MGREREEKDEQNNKNKNRKENETSTFHLEKDSSPQFLPFANIKLIFLFLNTIVSLVTTG